MLIGRFIKKTGIGPDSITFSIFKLELKSYKKVDFLLA
jgi:hypothetical protein